MTPREPLHEMRPTTRFSDRAADYARFRPTYPAEAIDAILAGMPALARGGALQAPIVAADVGAGTGISARLLAERGVRVIAIEPNDAMRAAAEPHPLIEWRSGAAEATGLPGASLDLVLCAQSYHWFEPGAACREFARILRPGGRLALMWNDGDETDPVARGYYDLVREASDGAGPTSHQSAARNPTLAPPFDPARVRRLRFRNEQRLDESALIGRAMSASYVPKTGPRADRLVRGLRDLHARHAGSDWRVGLVYEVLVYLDELNEPRP
ncbi:MAG: class I SAM-dependent methyltransferase [Phycisphaeraceae bacterium]|nr:class I SAM-dependent methyltransferase [Phycisphaeraceae bacterium]